MTTAAVAKSQATSVVSAQNQTHSARLLNAFLKAADSAEVTKIIDALPPNEYRWVPFGGTTGNKGQIKIATDPVRALVERITNSIDAVIERGIQEANIPDILTLSNERRTELGLTSPHDAITRYVPNKTDSYIVVAVTPRERWEQCTVDIFDRGIGIKPEMMPKTILSLSGSNKVSKPYQAGMYGQGGASSIGRVASNGYVIIASRAKGSPVGFTVVRYEKPTDADKRGHYSYLVEANGHSNQDGKEYPLPLFVDVPYHGKDEFGDTKKVAPPTSAASFLQGTLVRHLGYDLSTYRQQSRNPLSVYRGLNTSLFDALLPLRFMLPEKSKRSKTGWEWHPRTIEGSKVQLMDKQKAKVEWTTPEPITISIGKGLGTVDLEYWVLEAPAGNKKHPVQPSDFVHPNRPVVFTLNGQTHGEYSLYEVSQKLRPAIPYTSHSMIVHVALDGLTSAALDNLLSSGREDLVSGKVWDVIKEEIESLLIDDHHLSEIDMKRLETSLSSGHVEIAEDRRLKDSIAQIIERMNGESITRIFGGMAAGSAPRTEREPKLIVPIPPHDPPTFIKFAKKAEEALEFIPGKKKILNVETDAKDSLGKKVRVEAEGMEVRWTVLEGGHLKIAVQCPLDAKNGRKGQIVIHLGHLKDHLDFVVHVLTAEEKQAAAGAKKPIDVKNPKDGRRAIPKFDIQWTKPGDYNWVSVLGLSDGVKEQFAFDFRTKKDAGIVLYCSDEFPAYAKQVHAVGEKPHRAAIFNKHYIAQALVHVFKRADASNEGQPVDETVRQQIEMDERSCAATSFAVTAMRMLEEEEKKQKSVAMAA